MAMFQNLLVFYSCLALMFLAFGVNTPFTEIASGTSGLYNSTSGMFLSIIPVNGVSLTIIIAAIGGIGLLAGGFAIPVALGLFVGAIVLPLFTFPTALLDSAGMPDEFRILGIALFSVLELLFVISAVTYAKGSGE